MAKTYKVIIEETVVDTFEVEANSVDEARETAINKYWDGVFVLEPGEVVDRAIAVEQENGDLTLWEDF